ncbi:hypothetical protein [Gordonia aichiensis]
MRYRPAIPSIGFAVQPPSPGTPFGNLAASGFDSDPSVHAIDKFTGLKATWFARH